MCCMDTEHDLVHIEHFIDYETSINAICNSFHHELINQKKIILKPNLVNESSPPVTTSVNCCDAIVVWLKNNTQAEIIIAEGTGSLNYSTYEIFAKHGYETLSKKHNIQLVDLNVCETVLLTDSRCIFFPEFHMPKIVMESYLISVPVLKAHSLAIVSGTLKNMMGCAQPEYCQADNHWKKSIFHKDMQRSIYELNKYRTPDFTIMDATIGLAEHHLRGKTCSPPVNKLIASTDSVALDRKAAELLGRDWKTIAHMT